MILSSAKRERVASLLVVAMRGADYTVPQIDGAVRLWADFARTGERSAARTSEVYAGAVEYALALIERRNITQIEVARRHGISAGSVSRTYREIVDALGLIHHDPRYIAVKPWHVASADPDELLSTDDFLALLESDHSDAPAALDGIVRGDLLGLPRAAENWQIDKRALATFILEPYPFQPETVFVADETTQLAVGHRLLPPGHSTQAMLEALVDAMTAPDIGPPRRPERLTVPDALAASELITALEGLDIEVSCGPVPLADALFGFLNTSLQTEVHAESGPYLNDGVGVDAVADLFEAAAQLAQAEPWLDHTPCTPIAVTGPRVWATVLGAEGACRGLLIARDPSHLDLWLSPQLAADLDIDASLLYLGFKRAADLDMGLRKEILRHGWTVIDADHHPILARVRLDRTSVPLMDGDLALAADCAAAIASAA